VPPHGSFPAQNVNCFHRKYHFPQQQPQGWQPGQRPSKDPQTDDRRETEGAALQSKSFRHKAVQLTSLKKKVWQLYFLSVKPHPRLLCGHH